MQVGTKRRLAALMFTDIVGYSSLASKDEKLALELLEEHRAVFRRIFPLHGGYENKTIGDAFFIEFGSAVDALQCAMEIQTAFFQRNSFSPEKKKIQVRIGLHLGDVIEHDGDTYGDGVNIAARLEPLAQPGGVCLTRQIYDQILGKVDASLKRVGRIELKNIAQPTDVYRVVFPWEKKRATAGAWIRKAAQQLKKSWTHSDESTHSSASLVARNALLGLQAAAVSAVFACVVHVGVNGTQPKDFGREPASGGEKVSLFFGWKYQVARPDALGRQDGWHEFDIQKNWKYADQLHGAYRLKNVFEVKPENRFQQPAIVLGPIADRHRAYLNGKFIGGSNHLANVEYYPFDPTLLRYDAPNELVIEAYARPSLNPGLMSLSTVGSFLGELDETYAAAVSNRFSYHLLRTVFLVVALTVGVASFAFYASHPRQRKYLYYGLYLLLGVISLAYHNYFVASSGDFHFLRFIKVLGLSMSGFVLFSTWLALRRKGPWELANNAATVVVGSVIAYLSLPDGKAPSAFIDRYDGVLLFSTAYSLAWMAAAGIGLFRRLMQDLSHAKDARKGPRPAFRKRHELAILLFGAGNLLMLYTSLKSIAAPISLSGPVRSVIQSAGLAMPFAFALYVLAAAVADYVWKTKRVRFSGDRDNLMLEIARVADEATSLEQGIAIVQDKVTRFIGAERSTLYLAAENGQCLEARFVAGPTTSRHFLRTAIPSNEGVIGYAWHNRAPLLIHDLNTDLRFASSRAESGKAPMETRKESGYRTGSCMIFPLSMGKEMLGVLTVADKTTGHSFNRDDFALMHVVSRILALLIANAKLRESRPQKSAA